ncbi:heat-inducible transcriptional repressor HrcA [Beduini massiliensis]|uniref:heat-inducible transcriptional repressor HrcA n=1 Tax=Beduini massiliensis TaxID=1585974 RepID=UPI00059AA3C0|nr:heat-inducible transcriptional repressor HrcA [Beduini massiliensis]
MLTSRQITIFKAIVDAFVETAEPVGSKYLLERYQLPYSSATIRNEMAALEEYGYLEKTHTSSGRIPSVEGYKYYVETLTDFKIEDTIKNQMQTIFSERGRTLNEVVKESCEMLSQLTHLTSIALGPDARNESLQNITIVPISNERVSVIIVTDMGHVENKTFILDGTYSYEDLISCVGVMNEMLIGTPINQVIIRLEKDVKPIISSRIQEHEVLFRAFLEAFVKFASKDVYFSGKENMLYQPEFNDVNKLRRLVSAFENSQMWQSIGLNEEEGVTVKIGQPLPLTELEDVSVISGSFKTGSHSSGTISVIGPTRMPYEQVVSLVDYVSKNIEELFFNDDDEDDE